MCTLTDVPNITINILDNIHSPVLYLKPNSKGLSVLHIASPLRAQQVNAICRLVTMVYQHNYHNSGHYS
jgi:hypothetical protein